MLNTFILLYSNCGKDLLKGTYKMLLFKYLSNALNRLLRSNHLKYTSPICLYLFNNYIINIIRNFLISHSVKILNHALFNSKSKTLIRSENHSPTTFKNKIQNLKYHVCFGAQRYIPVLFQSIKIKKPCKHILINNNVFVL